MLLCPPPDPAESVFALDPPVVPLPSVAVEDVLAAPVVFDEGPEVL
jgi:hypothetical protein